MSLESFSKTLLESNKVTAPIKKPVNSIKEYIEFRKRLFEKEIKNYPSEKRYYIERLKSFYVNTTKMIDRIDAGYPLDTLENAKYVLESVVDLHCVNYDEDNHGINFNVSYELPIQEMLKKLPLTREIKKIKELSNDDKIILLVEYLADVTNINTGIEENRFNSIDIIIVILLLFQNIFLIDIEMLLVESTQDLINNNIDMFGEISIVKKFTIILT